MLTSIHLFNPKKGCKPLNGAANFPRTYWCKTALSMHKLSLAAGLCEKAVSRLQSSEACTGEPRQNGKCRLPKVVGQKCL